MNLVIPFALIAAVTICGIGEKRNSTPSANSEPSSSDRPSSSSPERSSSTPTPTPKPSMNRDEVQDELVSLANDIAQASMDGDVSFIAKSTTDDFQFTDIDGSVKSKNKTLAEVKQQKQIKSFEIVNEKLISLDESTAVLTYTLKVTAKNGGKLSASTIDTYAKQDGEWLLKTEQQTLLLK